MAGDAADALPKVMLIGVPAGVGAGTRGGVKACGFCLGVQLVLLVAFNQA